METISTTHYRGYTINKERYGDGYYYYASVPDAPPQHGFIRGYGPKPTQGFTAKTLPSIKRAIDRREGSSRGRRRNPLAPDTQKWLLIGVGGAVLAGIAYALYQANRTATPTASAGGVILPPQPLAFPPATVQQTTASSPTPTPTSPPYTPAGTNQIPLQIPLQAQNAPVITTAGGNARGDAWNPGY